MLFFDANVIVYSIVNLDEEKLKTSQQLVNNAFDKDFKKFSSFTGLEIEVLHQP